MQKDAEGVLENLHFLEGWSCFLKHVLGLVYKVYKEMLFLCSMSEDFQILLATLFFIFEFFRSSMVISLAH